MAEFLMVAVPLVRKVPPPIEEKPVGRKPISSELKALALLIKAWHNLTYRGTVTELRDHWGEFRRYGYEEIPSHTTLWRAMRKMPVAWFRQFNQELNELFDGDGRWTGDSTGFSASTYLRWRDMTGRIESAKRVAVKLHCLIHLAPLPEHPLRRGDRWSCSGCANPQEARKTDRPEGHGGDSTGQRVSGEMGLLDARGEGGRGHPHQAEEEHDRKISWLASVEEDGAELPRR